MIVTKSIAAARRQVGRWRKQGFSVGLIPTMGALHNGHRALIRRSRRLCDRTVVSIFVNPTQFAPGEDYRKYPRAWREDLTICRAEKIDLAFAPVGRTIYPTGFQTSVHVGPLADLWEGAARPGHFDGVATVVLKLFNIVGPDVAIFGQKDFQQAVIIRRLIADFNLPIRLVVVSTVRERDGLALSSRNVYLDPASRADATAIFRALKWARTRVRRRDAKAAVLRARMKAEIEAAGRFKVDYIGFCNPETLEPRCRLETPLVILVATVCRAKGAAFGRRYIDNVLIGV
ncbi:MAG: pantoate--beta-alanine ligase [candidate division Zixibacteria bacterium]|nr:pantoate--beta-alanine ligase [candidate division Zixibacteria bacterium]